MKAIKIGTKIEIYNDTVMTFNELPARTYIVRFEKMSGFYLDEYAEAEIKEDKIYGEHMNKVKKVLRTYRAFNRNLGVILSGFKGIGKSLFARILTVEAVKNGIPVIVVDKYIPGIASYIETIDQCVMVLFDEFDKTFGDVKAIEGEVEPQAALLGLFDGRERSCLSLHVMMSGNSMILLLTDRDGFTIIFASSTRLRRKSGHIYRIS